MSMRKTVYVGPYIHCQGPLEPSIEHQYHQEVGERLWMPDIMTKMKPDDIYLPNVYYPDENRKIARVVEDGGYLSIEPKEELAESFARFFASDMRWLINKYSRVGVEWGVVVYWS